VKRCAKASTSSSRRRVAARLVKQRFISSTGVEIFVVDEADRMLDMGFIRGCRAHRPKSCRVTATRCCSRGTCRYDIAKLARDMLYPAASRIDIYADRTHGRRRSSTARVCSRDVRTSRAQLIPSSSPNRRMARVIVFPAQPRPQQGRPTIWEGRRCPAMRSTATRDRENVRSARPRRLPHRTHPFPRRDRHRGPGASIDRITHSVTTNCPNVARKLCPPHRPHRARRRRRQCDLACADELPIWRYRAAGEEQIA